MPRDAPAPSDEPAPGAVPRFRPAPAPSAAIIVPTQNRPDYLDVALASIVPQAAEHGAELIVVDDGPSEATQAVARRHGARCIAHDRSRGLNAARNSGIAATSAELLVFVDDDVEVAPGWLGALLRGAAELPADAGVLTGPIRWRVEGRRFRACGREGGPITWQDFGDEDGDCPHAWGANMTIRRSAIERAGPFEESHALYGDEAEWQARWTQAGGRIHYLAAAALDHRRAGDDARLRSLCRAARARGRASRWTNERAGTAPSIAAELRTLIGCALHGPRRRCAMGPVMTWHTLGRIEAALRTPPAPAATAGVDDFLSGSSGNVQGVRALIARAKDLIADARTLASRRAGRLRAAAGARPRRRVLVLAVERSDVRSLLGEARAELERSRHEVEIAVTEPGARGKFENLNRLLAEREFSAYDWVLVIDDDVTLPRGFLDAFLQAAEQAGLRVAQPAHRFHSHAAWPVTRRRPGLTARATTFVEIGPVTAFHSETFAALLPFPDLRMGWGLDAHWSAVAREHDWTIGIVDATPIGHTLRPAASTYPREEAVEEARRFLDGRDYVRRDDVRTLVEHR